MAAARTYSTLFDSAGSPAYGRPLRPPTGTAFDFVSHTFATTELDDIADRVGLIPLQSGRKIGLIFYDVAELDDDASATLDADLVLRVEDASGNVTDTVLFNAGTTWQSAATGWVLVDQTIGNSPGAVASLDFKVVAAAASAVAGAAKFAIFYR